MIYLFLNKNKLFFLLAPLILFLQLPLLTSYPIVLIDEPWYGNTIFNVFQQFKLVNTLYGSGGGDGLFFYTLIAAGWSKLVGFSFFKLRLLSVLLELVGLYFFLACLRKLNVVNIYYICFGAFMFIVNNNIFALFRRIRPEGLSLLCLMGAIYCYLSWLEKPFKHYYLFICGLAVMLGFMAHPNMIIYGFLFGFFILWDQFLARQIKPVFYYVTGCIITFSCFWFLYYIMTNASYIDFFFADSVNARWHITFQNFYKNFVTFPKFYSLGVKRLFIFVFECAFLVVPFFFLKHQTRLKRLGLMGLLGFISSLIMLSPFFRTHFSYVVIFSCFVYLGCLPQLKHKKVTFFVLIVGTVYCLNNFAGDFYILYKHRNNVSLNEIQYKIQTKLGLNLDKYSISGPMHLWFLNPHNYRRIKPENIDQSTLNTDIIIEMPFTADISPTTGLSNAGLYRGSSMQNTLKLEGYERFSLFLTGYGKITLYKKRDLD